MSQTYKLRGRVAAITEPRTTSGGYTFQGLLVRDESSPQYPQEIQIDFGGDRISSLSGLTLGQDVEVAFTVRGSEYNGRHFVNLRGLGVSVVAPAPVQTVAPISDAPRPTAAAAVLRTDHAGAPLPTPTFQVAPAAPAPVERVEDLPF